MSSICFTPAIEEKKKNGKEREQRASTFRCHRNAGSKTSKGPKKVFHDGDPYLHHSLTSGGLGVISMDNLCGFLWHHAVAFWAGQRMASPNCVHLFYYL